MSQGLLVQLAMEAEWGRIDLVRQAVGRSVAAVFGDSELSDALAMVSAELLENAVKYGAQHGEVRFSLECEGERVVIRVSNAVDVASPHRDLLLRRLAWLDSFPSSADAYVAALAQVYQKGDAQADESGLGIVRSTYEGGCRIECDTSEPGRITVRASRSLTARGSP